LFDGGDMNEKAPRGCVTCYAALNEIIKPERPMGYFPLQWETAFEAPFGKAVDGLDDFDLLRMIRAANDLQGQLVGGTRIACYIGQNDLKNFPSHAFASEGSAKCLVKGRVLHNELEKEIFIRGDSFLPPQSTSDEPNALPSGASREEANRVGRKNVQKRVEAHLRANYSSGKPSKVSIGDWCELVKNETGLEFKNEVFRKARKAVYSTN
jgi:hypothetical protein